MKTFLTRAARLLGALAILLLFVSPALAQEADERKANKIEVKDGKVYVNGEMIKELEDSDLRVFFSKEGDNEVAFFHGSDDMPFRNFSVHAPRIREFMDREPIVGWVDGDFEFAEKDFENAFENGMLYNRLDVLKGGPEGNFVFRSDDNSEIRKLERKSQELARKWRRAAESDKAELNQQLESLVNEIFALKLAEQEQRIENLSEKLNELQAQLRERSDARSQIIQRRLSDLRGEQDVLDW